MLNSVTGWILRQVNTAFVLLLLVILLLGSTILSSAASNTKKVKKEKIKAKKGRFSKVAPVNAIYKEIGKWDTISPADPDDPGPVAIHMSVLPNEQVIYWGYGNTSSQTIYQIWDPTSSTGPSIAGRTTLTTDYGNMYCSGHSFLPDGSLLVAGGQEYASSANNTSGFTGNNKASLFHYQTGWQRLPNMNDRRWYPATLTLGNGNSLVWAGVSTNEQSNNVPQILEKQADGSFLWRTLSVKSKEPYNIIYSWLHLLSSGNPFVIYAWTSDSYLLSLGERSREPRLFSYPLDPLDPQLDGTLTDPHDSGSSVKLDKDIIMALGGNDTPKVTAEIINMSDPTPKWERVARMRTGRRHMNATLLPDGKVFVNGGNKGPGFNNDCSENFVYKSEMWDPSKPGIDQDVFDPDHPEVYPWKEMATATQTRVYHSTAVLLPDGRVLTGGSTSYVEAAQTCDDITDNHNLEIYSPPYLFNSDGSLATRPQIASMTETQRTVNYGQSFQFSVTGADINSKITLIRLPSVTHSFNQNQGVVKLTPSSASGQNLTVTIPSNRNECPPGHYMMFVLTNGVPSKAAIIKVT